MSDAQADTEKPAGKKKSMLMGVVALVFLLITIPLARLVDVLLLADAIPHRPRGGLTFPRVRSA